MSAGLWFNSEKKEESVVGYKEPELPPLPSQPIQIPSQDLSHAFLIKQSTLLSLETSASTLNRTLAAILDLNQLYCAHLGQLISIIQMTDDQLPVIFSNEELYDTMVKLKLIIKKENQSLYDLKLLFEYTKKLMESSIETSFLAGAEEASVQASETLFKAQQTFSIQLSRSTGLEQELQRADLRHIEATNKKLSDARGEGGGGVDQHAMADQAKTLEEVRPSSKPSQNQKSTNIKVSIYDPKQEVETETSRDGKPDVEAGKSEMEAGLPEGKADKPEVGPTPLFSFQQDGDETIKITIKEEEETDDIKITEKELEDEDAEKTEKTSELGQYKMPTF